MTTDIVTIDGEVVASAPITLFGTDDPVAVVERATAIAAPLADVIRQKRLFKHIGNHDYVFVEGWSLLGSMLGVFAEIEWSRPIENGWEARAVARTLAGRIVGAGEAMCDRSEAKWKTADAYSIRSMAQTRAVSKALRLPLGFIVALAGYSATPAEEMPATDKPGQGARPSRDTGPVPASAPSLDQIKTRLLERADEHHIAPARLDELIKEYVPANPDADTLKAKLIELGTDITRGKFDDHGASGAPTEPVAVAPGQMSAEEAIIAGAALVGKTP